MANARNERRKRERARRRAELKENDPALYRVVAADFMEGRIRDMAGRLKESPGAPKGLVFKLAECGADDDVHQALKAAYLSLANVYLLRPRPTSQRGHILNPPWPYNDPETIAAETNIDK